MKNAKVKLAPQSSRVIYFIMFQKKNIYPPIPSQRAYCTVRDTVIWSMSPAIQ